MRSSARILLVVAATAALLLTTIDARALSSSDPLRCVQPNGRVTTIVVSGGTAYLGGSFTSVTDTTGTPLPRSRIAAVATATCALTSWAPSPDAEVESIAVAGDTVYFGGEFRNVNGANRSRLAAVSTSTGQLRSFSHSLDRPVLALAASSTVLYAGGQFTSVDGQARGHLAAFSLSTGALNDAWHPATSGRVNAVAVSENRVYIGGTFDSINGQTGFRSLAAVDSASGALVTAFQPSVKTPVDALAVDAAHVYSAAAGQGGSLVIHQPDGTLQQPVRRTDGDLEAVAVDGNSVFAGGHFNNYVLGPNSRVTRNKVFELSLSAGAPTDFAPRINSALGVFSLAVDPATHRLWVGGDFTRVNKDEVAHLAVFG